MSLFGLGDFGEGFVTGLADSASDAIQKDMDAVRARIEKLSDFQANKIIKDQYLMTCLVFHIKTWQLLYNPPQLIQRLLFLKM